MPAGTITHVINLAEKIQQIPAPVLNEARRAEFVKQEFIREGLDDVYIDKIGNVFARLPGSGSAKPLVITAHLDTVFPIETELRLRREVNKVSGPGIGDNSIGVAGLFGLMWELTGKDSRVSGSEDVVTSLPGDIWLVANVGEEGLGDLVGMRAVVDHFDNNVTAYLILEGMALGQIYHRALGVKRYRIEISGPGGHSWVDYGKPSAINELGKLIVELSGIPLKDTPRTSLNVGVVSGGTSVNTIAGHAQMELDLRSEDEKELIRLVSQVEQILEKAKSTQVVVEKNLVGSRPAGDIPLDHPLVQLARSELLKIGINPNMAIGSTDANIPLSRGLPAVCVGITRGAGAHTPKEYIYLEPLESGLSCLVSIVRRTFEIPI